MKYLDREIKAELFKFFLPNKVMVLLVPRRVGKTVLLKQIIQELTEPFILLNGEDVSTTELFKRRSISNLRQPGIFSINTIKLLFWAKAQQTIAYQ